MKKLGLLLGILFSFAVGTSVQAADDCNASYQKCMIREVDTSKCEAAKAQCEKLESCKSSYQMCMVREVDTKKCEDARTQCEKSTETPDNTTTTDPTSKSKTDSDSTTKAEPQPKKSVQPFQSQFDPDKIFPSWDKTSNRVKGVIGRNRRDGNENGEITLDQGDTKILIYFIPKLISILFKVVAPIVVIMFIYSGVQFIYAGDDEELLKKSKSFFQYALMGVVFIIFTYSAMKSIYYILSENTPQQDTEKTEMVVSKKSDLSTKSTTSKSVDDEKEDKCLQQFKENDQALMSCPIGYEECSQKATEMSKNGASHEVVASERTKCINLQKESQFRCFDKKSKNSGYTSCLKTQVSCNADCLNDFFLDKQNSKFCMAACLDEVKACNKEIYDECKNSNS